MSEQHGSATQRTKVLSLCDRSGNMVRPWADAGHDCLAVDLHQDNERVETVGYGSITYVQADVREYEPPAGEYVAAFAFPPCTDLAVSGARWLSEKGLSALAEAIEIVAACKRIVEALDCPWMIEHPVSTLSTHWREPDYRFDPFEFQGYTSRDESYTKKTCLWTGGGFQMPRPDPDGLERQDADDRIHKMPPGEERAEKRSETPTGFARAVLLAHDCPEEFARADSGTVQTDLQEVSAHGD